jgi:hypothetical protein
MDSCAATDTPAHHLIQNASEASNEKVRGSFIPFALLCFFDPWTEDTLWTSTPR